MERRTALLGLFASAAELVTGVVRGLGRRTETAAEREPGVVYREVRDYPADDCRVEHVEWSDGRGAAVLEGRLRKPGEPPGYVSARWPLRSVGSVTRDGDRVRVVFGWRDMAWQGQCVRLDAHGFAALQFDGPRMGEYVSIEERA